MPRGGGAGGNWGWGLWIFSGLTRGDSRKNFLFEGGLWKLGYIKNVASFWGASPPRPPLFLELQIYTCNMLAFHLSLGLFMIIFVNKVTFCQAKAFQKYGCESMCTWYIIIVVEVKACGIHSFYPDFRVFDSLMIRSVPFPFTIGTS